MPGEVVVDPDLDFSNAFADFSKTPTEEGNAFGAALSDPPVVAGGNDPVLNPADPAPAEPDPAPAPADPTPAPAGDVPVDVAPAPPAPAVDEDERLARFAKIIKDEIAPPPAPPAPPPQPEPELYTADEKKTIETYLKDWPDVAKADALIRRAEYVQLDRYFQERLQQVIQPIAQIVRTLSEKTQLQDLRSEVSDYDDIHGKVVEWVGKQPAYLQVAYNHVVQSGTPEEVVDLINRFKQDTGYAAAPAAAQAAVQAAAAPAKAVKAPTPAARQAAAALAPVAAKRSAVPQGEPATFDDAFAAFASKL